MSSTTERMNEKQERRSAAARSDKERAAALADAVRAGALRSAEIRDRVDAALERTRAAVATVRVEEMGGQAEAQQVASQFSAVFGDACDRLERLFADQQARMGSVNVVLFGRTGAGKSSVITALVRGNGKGISPGRTDFTDEVLDLRWRDDLLRVKDTPGTQGPRAAELAEVARDEVALADVVLLAFDDGSQLRGEFAEVARHVKALGKPAIAILNVKNKHWGDPTKALEPRERRGLAKEIRDHASHIREQLGALGLDDVPVVAISAQRAVYARAAGRYLGPDKRRCSRLRARDGRDLLLERSNFVVLETLLDSLATHDPAHMRTAMLSQQAAAVLAETAASTNDLAGRAELAADALEAALGQLLRLTGAPEYFRTPQKKRRDRTNLGESAAAQLDALREALRELELLRGGGFPVGSKGELETLARQYATADLAAAERATRARASTAIGQAMRARRKLTEAEFRVKMISDPEVKAAMTRAGVQLGSYLNARVDAIAKALEIEMDRMTLDAARPSGGVRLDAVGVAGDSGRAADRLSIGLSLGEILLPLGAIAATQFWNPAGWSAAVGAAVVAVAGAVAWAIGKIARLFKKKSSEQRESEITRATAEAERVIREGFADLRRRFVERLVDMVRGLLLPKLLDITCAARTLRQASQAAREATEALNLAASGVPHEPRRAQESVRTATVVTAGELGADGVDLWLYERWIGQQSAADESTHEQAERPATRLPRTLGRTVSGEQAQAWLSGSARRFTKDRETATRLRALARASGAPPNVVVVGDYNTGKTSFLRRLHWERGLPAPARLRVGARPETEKVSSYLLGGVRIVDTPGHQSERRVDSSLARDALVGASLVVCLFGPPLITGSTDEIDVILGSHEPEARLRLINRTLWVINLVDQLSADPLDDPVEFLAACERKRTELKRQLDRRPALVAVNGSVDLRRVLCCASDPYGLLKQRRTVPRERLDRYASWDGMADLTRVLTRLKPKLSQHAVPTGSVESGIRALWERGAELTARSGVHRSRIARLDEVIAACEAEARNGRALRASMRDDARGLARARVTELLRALDDPDRRPNAEKQLRSWWTDKLLQEHMAAWQKRAGDDMAHWHESASSRVDALIGSKAFRASWGHAGSATPSSPPPDHGSSGLKGAQRAASGVKAIAKGADRKTVLKIGHSLGRKFRPWQAKKVADRFVIVADFAGRADVMFAALTALWGLRNLVKDRKKTADALDRFNEARQQLLADVEAWADAGLSGTEREPGILLALDADISELVETGKRFRSDKRSESRLAAGFDGRALAHRHTIDAGLRTLGRPITTVGPWT